MLRKIYYILSLFPLVMYSHQAEVDNSPINEEVNLKKAILAKGDQVILWEKLRLEIVNSEVFKEAFNELPAKSLQDWEAFLKETDFFDSLTKEYILGIIDINSNISLKDILHNKVTSALLISELLILNVAGEMKTKDDGILVITDTSLLKEVLVKKAIEHVKEVRRKKENGKVLTLSEQEDSKIEGADNIDSSTGQVLRAVQEDMAESGQDYWGSGYMIYYMLGLLLLFVFIGGGIWVRRRKK